MKENVFSVFLLSLFVVISFSSESDIVEKVITDLGNDGILKVPEEADTATKGAIIEAIFILQNKKNSLARHLRRVKIALIEIDHLIKDLVYERQLLFDHFYRNKAKSNGQNIIDRILVDLSVFYGEMLHINLVKGLYPNYAKQIQKFIADISNTIEQLVAGNPSITFCDLKTTIDKFDNILDIIEKEEQFLKLVLEIENIKLSCKKYKDRITSRENQLTLYEGSIINKEDPFFIDQKGLIESSIKRLKKNMTALINDLESKFDKIKSFKQSLMNHYDKHQLYYQPNLLCPHRAKLTSSDHVNLRSTKIDSLGWFIDTLENIRKKLNKNFNIEDLG